MKVPKEGQFRKCSNHKGLKGFWRDMESKKKILFICHGITYCMVIKRGITVHSVANRNCYRNFDYDFTTNHTIYSS